MTASARPAPFGAALIGAAEREALAALLAEGTLYRYHGSAVSSLEQRFASWLGEGVLTLAVNSGTSALQLALAACELSPGDEVLVPTFGFVSAATAVHAVGAVPRFVGVDRSLAIDVAAAAEAIGERTRAVLAVHPYGTACDLTAVAELAERFDLRVVEDVAQACGGSFGGRRLGTFGDAAAFSFQHFKLIATGEGGMAVTADRDAHDRISFLHDSAAIWTLPERAARVKSVAGAPGNLRMSELEGAIGLVQLGRCDELIASLGGRKRQAVEALAAAGRCSPAPAADPAGDAGTHLIAYLPQAGEVDGAVAALRARGVTAATLLGEPGSNRHWARDWRGVLERCGLPAADAAVLERDRTRLEAGLVLPLEAGAGGDRAGAWLEAVEAVLA